MDCYWPPTAALLSHNAEAHVNEVESMTNQLHSQRMRGPRNGHVPLETHPSRDSPITLALPSTEPLSRMPYSTSLHTLRATTGKVTESLNRCVAHERGV